MRLSFYCIFTALLIFMKADAQSGFARLNGRFDFLTDGDIVILTVYRVGYPLTEENTVYRFPVLHNQFHFKVISSGDPKNISISYKKLAATGNATNELLRSSLYNYYIQQGDNITITVKKGTFKFTGKNAAKFRTINGLHQIENQFTRGISWDDPLNAKVYFLNRDSLLMKQYTFLENHRIGLSPKAFTLLKADILGIYLSRYNFVNAMQPEAKIQDALENLKGYRSLLPPHYLDTKEFDKSSILRFSDNYSNGIRIKYLFEKCTLKGKTETIMSAFNYFTQNYSGGLRERLLLNELYWKKESAEDNSSYLNRALTLFKYKPFIAILDNYKAKRLPGAAAYDFTLSDTSGVAHQFSAYKGKVVLLDFWFTGCGSCRLSASYLKQVESHFIDKPVVFITISLDKKRDLWVSTVKGGTYTSGQSVNLFTNGKGFDHPIVNYYQVDGCPTFILIDKKGKLLANPENPRFDNGVSLTALIEREISN